MLPVLIAMKLMQHAVNYRREDHARADQEYQSRVECVKAGKQLAVFRFRNIDGSHAAHQHRGIQKCVRPAGVLEVRVARHAGEERQHEQGERSGGVQQDALDEANAGDSARDGGV